MERCSLGGGPSGKVVSPDPVAKYLENMSLLKLRGKRPDDLGVHDGRLKACPSTPNCVCSQDCEPRHAISPIFYECSPAEAMERLIKIVNNTPRTRILESGENYLRAEFSTLMLGFVDDVEFYLPPTVPRVEMRSASRLGHGDLGVNRRRLEAIRKQFHD